LTKIWPMEAQTPTVKEIHVLSLDGGGSRGLMEAVNLDHIMKLATVMKKKPEKIRNIVEGDGLMKQQETVDKIVEVITEVQPEEAIHPTEAFQFIVGTSMGALIAFGLVGGNTDRNGERCPMTVEEIIELYKTVVPKIFVKSKAGSGFIDWFLRNGDKYIYSNKSVPYTQDEIKKEVEKRFGRSRTDEVLHDGVVAAAVAKQFNEGEGQDLLEIFDSKSDPPQLVSEVLLGSADAPIFFEIPAKIGMKNYIDGGVQGNCPLVESLPRAKEIWPECRIKSVLSLAPPPNKPSQKLTELKEQWKKTGATLSYLIHQLTDGEALYESARKNHKDVFFQRTRPSLQTSMGFEMDETDVEKMAEAMEKELRENTEYLSQIVDNAAVIACRTTDLTAQHLTMFEAIADSMTERRQYKDGLHLVEAVLALNAFDCGTLWCLTHDILRQGVHSWSAFHCWQVS